jgi:hypothetical protein
VSYGISELWHIGAFEFLNQLHELSMHFAEGTKQEFMSYFYKYYKETEILNY